MGNRERKAQIGTLLRRDDDPDALAAILAIPARQAVGPLFAFFYSGDDTIRWRAISAMGMVVSRLADRDMEAARVVMRRLMWNLNDESGGIGWGSP
jgi:DNA-binding GntR family transcriptional regulator